MHQSGSVTPPCSRCGGTGVEPDSERIASRIRAARKERGWGVREVARRAHCSPSFVSYIERGAIAGVGGEKTAAVLDALGLTAGDLVA